MKLLKLLKLHFERARVRVRARSRARSFGSITMSHRTRGLRWIPVRLFATGSAMILSVLVATFAEQHLRFSAIRKEIAAVAREVAHSHEPSSETDVQARVRTRLARAGVNLTNTTVEVRFTDRYTEIIARHQRVTFAVGVANRRKSRP